MSADKGVDYGCYDEEHSDKCAALSNDLFGRQLACAEIAELVGAMPDAHVMVRCGTHYPPLNRYGRDSVNGVMIVVSHPFYEVPQIRIIFRDASGTLTLFNQKFRVDKNIAPSHTGTRVLARSVRGLLLYNSNTEARYRIEKIRTHAFSWSDAYNGAYTWARLGYNARLDEINPDLMDKLRKEAQAPQYHDELRQALNTVETLNELILVGGEELWRKSHEEFWGDFDLNPTSDSVAILRKYVEDKGIEL